MPGHITRNPDPWKSPAMVAGQKRQKRATLRHYRTIVRRIREDLQEGPELGVDD